MAAQDAEAAGLKVATRSLLAGVSHRTRRQLDSIAMFRRFAAGHSLFLQGDPPSFLILVMSGRVKVWRALKGGGALTLTVLRRGAPLGTLGAIREVPHNASATALEPVEVMNWPIAEVRRLMMVDHALMANLLLTVTNYAEEMVDRLEEVATIPVEQRLARTLLRAARNPWGDDPPPDEPLPLSRQDLADLTSTTLPTVSRIMSRWRSEGLLEGGGRGRVVVGDADRLARLADLPSEWERPLESALAMPL